MSRLVAIGLLAVVVVAACGSTGPSPTATGPWVIPSEAPTPAPVVDPSATVRPTEVPGPPVASIVLGDAPVDGELGSFSWDGLSSDAPWLIPRDIGSAVADQALDVTLDPALEPAAWNAIWAPIRDSAPARDGRVSSAGSGRIAETLRAPKTAGDWSLSLTMRFAAGRSGTWYWHVAVEP